MLRQQPRPVAPDTKPRAGIVRACAPAAAVMGLVAFFHLFGICQRIHAGEHAQCGSLTDAIELANDPSASPEERERALALVHGSAKTAIEFLVESESRSGETDERNQARVHALRSLMRDRSK